jgi:hypothetical protein
MDKKTGKEKWTEKREGWRKGKEKDKRRKQN